jgi:hypothetical protein
MKLVTAEYMFPELKGPAISVKAAISRAFGDAIKQNRGKRYHIITATITIIEEAAHVGSIEQDQRQSLARQKA